MITVYGTTMSNESPGGLSASLKIEHTYKQGENGGNPEGRIGAKASLQDCMKPGEKEHSRGIMEGEWNAFLPGGRLWIHDLWQRRVFESSSMHV